MELTPITNPTTAVGAQNATTRGFTDLSSEDFFGLLIAELQSQDPLNPQDNQQLLAQMSSIRQMEQSSTLTKTLETLVSEQRFGATSSLIGHFVAGTVLDQAGNPFELRGIVIGVRFEGEGGAILELHNGRSLPAGKVEQVTLVENLPPEILEELEAELGGGDEGTESDPVDEGADEGEPVPVSGAGARPIFSDSTGTKSAPAGRRMALLSALLGPPKSLGDGAGL